MALSRNTKNAVIFAFTALTNLGLFSCGLHRANENHRWYLKQSREKQRTLYNTCPLQKYGSSTDGIAAIYEHERRYNPEQHRIKPLTPFDVAYPEKCHSSKTKSQ